MPRPQTWRYRNRRHFCRWTGPREAIMQLLSQTSQHLSAKEIYAAIHKFYPGIGLTTVYRTLDLLTRMGTIVMNLYLTRKKNTTTISSA